MPRSIDVPEPFCSAPFRSADALRAGLSRGVLDGPRFRRPFQGVRIPVSLPDTLALRCTAASLVLPPDAAFSHETAALLCRLPLPTFDEHVDVIVPPGDVVPHVCGVDGHTGLDPETVVVVHGLRVVHPERTFFHLAETLPMSDLVAFGDAVLRRWSTPARLAAAAALLAGRRGIVAARDALRLVRPGVDSPMETRVRLMIVGAGLPCPEVGTDVVDHTGAWLARPDMSFPELKIAIEYDGDHHRTNRRQWQRDRHRDERLRDLGWIVITLTADDILRYPQRTIERIRRHVVARQALIANTATAAAAA